MCFHCQAVIWPCQSEVTQDSVHPRAHESNDPNRRSFVWMTHFKQMCVSDMSCHLDKNKLCFNTSFVLHRQHIYIFSLSLQCMKTHVCTCCENLNVSIRCFKCFKLSHIHQNKITLMFMFLSYFSSQCYKVFANKSLCAVQKLFKIHELDTCSFITVL